MKDETALWLKFAEEDLESARLLLQHQHFNPCLQHIQQAVEKFLKAVLIEKDGLLQKTHSIQTLANIAREKNMDLSIMDDECEFIDSIYLPSKYPIGSVLPDFDPDQGICQKCLQIGEKLKIETKKCL